MKYEISLKSISPLIFSNRMNDALYKGIDFDKEKSEKEFNELIGANMVYQFSCYENRALRSDKSFVYSDSYYIPASSIKGALCLEEKYRNNKFKDIMVDKSMIGLSTLKKFQYLYQTANTKAIKYTDYFPKIKVEMMKLGQCVNGEMLSIGDKNISFDSIVNKVDLKTRCKLSEYLKQIRIIYSTKYFQELSKVYTDNDSAISKFKKVENRIEKLLKIQDTKIIFVGGFKGIIGGLNKCEFNDDELRNGFYIDEETMLPYGLAEINIRQK